MLTLAIVAAYFAALLAISRLTARGADNATFYRANGRAPWYMVAFGMVGASISGVTFVSVPGMVLTSQMTYLQVCLGFIAGYAAVAFVLLPLYYRLGLTSIYAYLGQRLGRRSYATGAWFFLLSKLTGSALKFYVVCMILQDFVLERAGVPFAVTAAAMVMLIWLYTRRGGIATLVFTDSFQTLCLLAALVLIIAAVVADLGLTPAGAVAAVAHSDMSRIFVFGDWASPHHFLKQFVSGAFIVVVMTGLDQDMMQKNLTCRTLADAQKDMCTYGVAFVPVNMLFLALGVLLTMAVGSGVAGDALLTTYVRGSQAASLFFVLGIVAASFSSADSALTSLTTSYCIDLRRRPDDERLRKRVHAAMCV
ncbi:MAG: sodium:solute symporter, partial [Bacteroidaceae bacterium]|nr:sodium:solute symporter [Bacteroidaceae bacterium]